jgi:hypothetical protein
MATQPKSAWRSFVDTLFNRDWENTGEVAATRLGRGVADTVGMIGDAVSNPIINPSSITSAIHTTGHPVDDAKAFVQELGRRVTSPLTGGGMSASIPQKYDEFIIPRPLKDRGDKAVGNVAETIGASIMPAGETGGIKSIIGSGVGGGLAQTAAQEVTDNPTLQTLANVAGAVVGGVAPHAGDIRGGMLVRDGASNPDFRKMVAITAETESHNNPDAVSPKGARGTMQVMPETARQPGYGIKPSDGTKADDVRVGTQKLAVMLSKYKHDPEKAWAAYNWGEGNLNKAISKYGDNWFDHAPRETQEYVATNVTKLNGGRPTPEGLAARDGLPTPGSVPPIDPAEMAKIMGDPEAAGLPDHMSDEDIMDSLPPANREYLDQQNNIANFEEALYNKRVKDAGYQQATQEAMGDLPDVLDQSHLTPAEAQEMDASAPKPDVESSYGAATPYEDVPDLPEAANTADDIERDPNPPASSSTFGTRSPEGVNRMEPAKGIFGHGKPKPTKLEDIPEADLTDEQRVALAIKQASPLRAEQEHMYTEERAKRFEAARNQKHVSSGEEGFHQELSKLAGEYPTVPVKASIRNKLGQENIANLFDQVRDHPALDYTDTIHGRTGLAKLLNSNGVILPTKSELDVLKLVFPDIGAVLKKKKTISSWIADGINAPRSIMASMDLSAALRQGLPMIHRKEYWSAFGSMFKQLGPKAFDEVRAEIRSRRSYPLMKKSGLSLTDVDEDLSQHEERFMSDLANKIPAFGHVVKASERAYVGFLNKLRADTFDSIVGNAREAGQKLSDKDMKGIANYINTATGRGDLNNLVPKVLKGEEFDVNKASPLLSGTLFSPRLMASRVAMLNPVYYVKLPPIARKEALKSLFAYTAVVTTTLGLAKAAGLDVETDPTSTDFARIKVGNTRYDVTAGFQPFVRLAAQLMTGEKKGVNGDVTSLTSGGFGQPNRLSAIGDFLKNKESPPMAFAHDLLTLQDRNFNRLDAKHPMNVAEDIGKDFIPLVAQDMYGVYQDQGGKGVATAVIPDVFGVGVQTYTPRGKKSSSKDNPFSSSNPFKSTGDPFKPSRRGKQKDDL